jgi:hypothetical protein
MGDQLDDKGLIARNSGSLANMVIAVSFNRILLWLTSGCEAEQKPLSPRALKTACLLM